MPSLMDSSASAILFFSFSLVFSEPPTFSGLQVASSPYNKLKTKLEKNNYMENHYSLWQDIPL